MLLANYENSSSTYFTSPIIFASAIALRTVLLFYGLFQDAYSPVKYTDIDYFVFTDAARYVSLGLSPYQRETYRYTPLLAWLLIPTTWPGPVWFSFGKVLFALADILAGYLIVHVLQSRAGGGMTPERALRFASIWLLNPMVAIISTRGSSEGLLCTMVVALLSAVIHGRIKLAGVLLGLGVHFKIYPFIYGTSIIWCLDESWPSNKFTSDTRPRQEPRSTIRKMLHFMNPARLTLIISSLATFTATNLLMYTIYSGPFLTHTFVHHLTRVDHRHNFSPYNILLYQSSSSPKTGRFPFESLAFGPQLALSAFLIPICLSKKDLPGAMLAQTFAFVSFNKVCTSQVCCTCLSLFRLLLVKPVDCFHCVNASLSLLPRSDLSSNQELTLRNKMLIHLPIVVLPLVHDPSPLLSSLLLLPLFPNSRLKGSSALGFLTGTPPIIFFLIQIRSLLRV